MSSYQGFQAASQGWSPRGVLGSWAPLTSRDWCWRRPQHYLRHVGLRSSQSCSATLPMPEIQAGWWQGWLSCICWRGWDCGGVRCCSLCERWQREDLHRASRGRSLCYFCCFLEKFVQLQESRWFSTPPPPLSLSLSLDENAAWGSRSTPRWCHFVLKWTCWGARRSAQGLCWGLRQALGAISQGNTTESAEPNQRATVMPSYLTGTIYVLETY